MDRGGYGDRGPPRDRPLGRGYLGPPGPEEGEYVPPPPQGYEQPRQPGRYPPGPPHGPADYGSGSGPSRGPEGYGPRGDSRPPAGFNEPSDQGYDSRQGRSSQQHERSRPRDRSRDKARERERERGRNPSGDLGQGYGQPGRYPPQQYGGSSRGYDDYAPAGSQYEGSSRGAGYSGGGGREYEQEPYYGDRGRSGGSSRGQEYHQSYYPAAAAAAGYGHEQGYRGSSQSKGPGYPQGSGSGSGGGPRQYAGYGGDQGSSYRDSRSGPVWGREYGPGPSREGSGGYPGSYSGGRGGHGGYGGGREAGRVQPGAHAGGVSAQHTAPYEARPSRPGPAQLQDLEQGKRSMLAVLAGKPQFHQDTVDTRAGSRPMQLRTGHGSVQHRQLNVLVNLFKLSVNRPRLYHYDVSFNKQRSSRSQVPGPSSGGPEELNPKPPENARKIMDSFILQYWVDDRGRALREAWAFDGGKNFVTAHRLKLRGTMQLPLDMHSKLAVTVRDVPGAGKGKNASWQVTFQLARELKRVDEINAFPARISKMLAEGKDTEEIQQSFFDTRQALEWVLKQALIAAHEVMEVRRTLYFADNIGNRNIGGGLRAIIGLSTGIKQGESQVLFAADVTASAFLRTDINLVQCMADVAGFHLPTGGGGRGFGGRGDLGRGGPGGGRGRGRSLPEVGEPDVRRLLEALRDERQRRTLFRLFERTLHNKKVVYKDPKGQTIRKFTAVGFTPEPANQARFYCQFKEPDAQGRTGADIDVAYYFERLAQPPQRLEYPQLPAVVMKVPKSKPGQEERKLWIPPERLYFDRNQRQQAVTHKGGIEQMIEAARKQPAELARAIEQPILTATTGTGGSGAAASSSSSSGGGSGGGKEVLSRMKVELGSKMQEIKARVLPGPWLSYKQGRAGREETKSFNTGTSGTWNMNAFKFANAASLHRWGIVALLPRRDFERPQNPYNSLSTWVLDFIKRCDELGMDMGFNPQEHSVVASERLCDRVMHDMEWVEAGEDADYRTVESALRRVRERSGGHDCQLILCFISHKPSPLYSRIKVCSELQNASGGGLGLVTQIVVAGKTDLGNFARGPPKRGQRSQYQANLAMKVNAKVGGVNTCWSVLGHQLLREYFNKEVPAIQVFGIDMTHPGKVPGARSKAAVVGSLDPAYCRYAQSYWEESLGGSEILSKEHIQKAFTELITKYYEANRGVKPGSLLVYRDGVSDSELDRVRVDEVSSIIEACASLQPDGNYRPRIVYMVVQKRHHVRLFNASAPGQLSNVEPGTVIDHTIVSPAVCDFYLNSHKDIQGAGTSRATRYICVLDELGFGPDGLQVFTYWLCYLYCRCTRAVSIVAPVYYAHLLAYRVRVLDEGDSMSMGSGSTGSGGRYGMREEPKYCDSLTNKMFFV